MKPAVRRLLLGGGGVANIRNYSAANPLYLAHRGNSRLAPEDTIEAMEDAIRRGAVGLETDVHLLADGGLAVMHDTTVDRTTTGTGTISLMTTAAFKASLIDAQTQGIPGWGDALVPPLFGELLSRLAGKAIIVAEAKVSSVASLVPQALTSAGIKRTQAMVESFSIADLRPSQAMGYEVMLLLSTASAAVPANITSAQAAGIRWVGMDTASADADFQSWIAAGFKVIVYTAITRRRRDQLLALGVAGFFTDEEPYLSGRDLSASTWADGKFMHGMISAAGTTTASSRGTIQTGGWWGWPDATNVAVNMFVLQGWAGFFSRPSFSVQWDMRINAVNAADATRWGGLFFADASMSDDPYTDLAAANEKGYNFICRQNGQLAIFRPSGGTSPALTSVNGAALALAETVRLKVTFTPTNVRFARISQVDGSEIVACNSNDATYRGGPMHFGRANSCPEFRNVTIT